MWLRSWLWPNQWLSRANLVENSLTHLIGIHVDAHGDDHGHDDDDGEDDDHDSYHTNSGTTSTRRKKRGGQALWAEISGKCLESENVRPRFQNTPNNFGKVNFLSQMQKHHKDIGRVNFSFQNSQTHRQQKYQEIFWISQTLSTETSERHCLIS